MKIKSILLIAISTIALFIGFIYSYLTPTPNFMAGTSLILLTLIFFISGILFFGYLTFIPSAIYGIAIGFSKNPYIFLYSVPIILAIYAGLILGNSIEDDFLQKDYFIPHAKKALFILALAVGAALIIEIILPEILTSLSIIIPEQHAGNTGIMENLKNAFGTFD